MSGCFLNMTNVNIGRTGLLERHISDIIIIMNKYIYTDSNLLNRLLQVIQDVTGADSIEFTRSITTKFAINAKISKGLKNQIKKSQKKKGIPDNTAFSIYFYKLLEIPVHDFLVSITDNFREAVNVEYEGKDLPDTYAAEVFESFLYMVQSGMEVHNLMSIVSLLERDNYILIEFL